MTKRKMDDDLGLDPEKEENNNSTISVVELDESDPDFNDDFKFARETILNSMESSKVLLDFAMKVAEGNESGYTLGIVDQILKGLVTSSKDLLDVHSKKQKYESDEMKLNGSTNISVDKAIFVGTHNDLLEMTQKMMEDKKKKTEIE